MKQPSVKANRRVPKSCLGQVFNFKLGHSDSMYELNCADALSHLELKTLPRFSPDSYKFSMAKQTHSFSQTSKLQP